MRVCSAFCRLLRLEGVWVRGIAFEPDRVVVRVALKRRRLACAHCSFSTPHRENRQARESVWRHLDLGSAKCFLEAEICRIDCATCQRVRTEVVPWARPGARHTNAFCSVVAWLAHESCGSNGECFSVGAGHVARSRVAWPDRRGGEHQNPPGPGEHFTGPSPAAGAGARLRALRGGRRSLALRHEASP